MSWWSEIYSKFDPIAFSFLGLNVHWYGIMYVLALLVALGAAKYFVKKDNLPFSDKTLDNYFIWVEIGVILGARLGFVFIYSDAQMFYIAHPWEIFNPFYNGKFVGISGMSYHGAVIGFIIATFWFCKKHNQNAWKLLDLVAICIPLGYIFGRIGNFLNQELVGTASDVPWAINVGGVLRHPSQLYEALLEGVLVFIILYIYRKYKKFDGELISLYVILYSIMRFISEIFRQPDVQIGEVFLGLSMGQILSFLMLFVGLVVYFYLLSKKDKNIV